MKKSFQKKNTLSICKIYNAGSYRNSKLYYNIKGYYSNVSGPAIIDSCKEWFVDGKRHRVGGPAIEYFNGEKIWYQNDLLHREDGPAVVDTSGKAYFLYGIGFFTIGISIIFYYYLKFDDCFCINI
jgi:hypothetical protein